MASGWSPLTATAKEQRSAAWASQPAAGAAAAAPSWKQAFSAPSEMKNPNLMAPSGEWLENVELSKGLKERDETK